MAWTDDPSILPGDTLWRRIPGWHFVWDANRNSVRASSAAFDNDPDGSPMSVQLAEVLAQHGLNEGDVLHGHRGFAIARFPAEAARHCGQGIARDPQPGEPAHAVVFGEKSERTRKKLGKASQWQTEPAALPLGDGTVLFEDQNGLPCVRLLNGRWEAVTPGPPPVPGWLETAQQWLTEPASAAAVLREAVERAVAAWTRA